MWKGAQQKKNENTTAADVDLYLFMLNIYSLSVYCISLYEENSTEAEEADHCVGLDWSYNYKKSIYRLREKKC